MLLSVTSLAHPSWPISTQSIVNNCIDRSAIVNDQLSVLELAITPDMGHDGWANDVTLRNIHEHSFFTSLFHLYKYGNTIRMHLRPTSKLGYLSFKKGF